MNSADSHDSAIPMALYDCKDVASNLPGALHSEFVDRKTDLFQKSLMRGTSRASFKMYQDVSRVSLFPDVLKKKKKEIR